MVAPFLLGRGLGEVARFIFARFPFTIESILKLFPLSMSVRARLRLDSEKASVK
jgi:hypothetical protein